MQPLTVLYGVLIAGVFGFTGFAIYQAGTAGQAARGPLGAGDAPAQLGDESAQADPVGRSAARGTPEVQGHSAAEQNVAQDAADGPETARSRIASLLDERGEVTRAPGVSGPTPATPIHSPPTTPRSTPAGGSSVQSAGGGSTGGSGGGARTFASGSGGSAGGSGGAGATDMPARANTAEPEPAPAPQAGTTRPHRVRAFHGAEGFGAYATGGRGGDVYIVSTLSDSGAGSFRYGIQSAKGPRTIVFQVAGTIYLSAPLSINKPNLTIAGQTAPGDGITLAGQPVYIKTQNLIMRHLRVRLGDINAADRPAGNHFGTSVSARPGNGLKNVVGEAGDALAIDQSENIILDHLSISWGMDETLSVTRSVNVTVQNCLIAEGLNDSWHAKGPHGYGSLIVGGSQVAGGVTFVRNLYMHHQRRSPAVAAYFPNLDKDGSLRLEFSNNVVYNWGDQAFHVTGLGGQLQVNFFGNLYLPGGDSPSISARSFEKITEQPLYAAQSKLVSADNTFSDLFAQPPLGKLEIQPARFPFPDVERYDPGRLLTWVHDYAGAFTRRDSVDTRLADDLEGRGGNIIDSQDDVGGFPNLAAGTPPVDTDHDGMPDTWERTNGLDPMDPEDRNFPALDAPTMLEKYLNSLIHYDVELTDLVSMYD